MQMPMHHAVQLGIRVEGDKYPWDPAHLDVAAVAVDSINAGSDADASAGGDVCDVFADGDGGDAFADGDGDDVDRSPFSAMLSMLCLELQQHVNPASSLRDVMKCVLPILKLGANESDAAVLDNVFADLLAKLPCNKTMRRNVVKMDLLRNMWTQHAFSNGVSTVASLGVDASEQHRHDYLMTRYEYVVYGSDWSDQEKLQKDWNRSYVSTILTSGCLGYGEATYGRKLHVLWHQANLITGQQIAFDSFRKSVKGVLTDQASTEKKLGDAPNLSAVDQVKSELDACERGDKSLEEVSSALFFFPEALSGTDPMHMIWNAFESCIKGKGTEDEGLWTEYEKRLRGMLLFLGDSRRRTRWLDRSGLCVEQKAIFSGWRCRIIDWKWQYMNEMWKHMCDGGRLFLETVDMKSLRKPVDTTDDREIALDNKSIDAIGEAVQDRDYFICQSEAYMVFSLAVNVCHNWLTSCSCHDHIWSHHHWTEARKQQEFERETGCVRCWRRGRRGSELARGEFMPIVKQALSANSTGFQQALAKLQRDRQIQLVHSLERMKRSWVEELVDKTGGWQTLPHLVMGIWPHDSQSQGIASKCLKQWDDLKAKCLSVTAHRITKKFCDDSIPDNVLAGEIRRLDETGEAGVGVLLASKEHNMMMTHCQRVEAIHAAFKRREETSITPGFLCASINLPYNLRVFRVWEAREFARLYWRVQKVYWLLRACDVSDAVRKHGTTASRIAAVYHSLPTLLFRSIDSTHELIQRWESAKTVESTSLASQEKMLMDSFFRRFVDKVISIKVLPKPDAKQAIVPAVYNEKALVDAAMSFAKRPIEYVKVGKGFSGHTFLKVVKTKMNARANMKKELFFLLSHPSSLYVPPPHLYLRTHLYLPTHPLYRTYPGHLLWHVQSCSCAVSKEMLQSLCNTRESWRRST